MADPTDPSAQTAHLIAVREARDKSAFVALFDFFAPRLKGMFMRNGMSAAQAEDIVQDAMLSVWHKAHQFDESRAQASAWIYRIARNRMVDTLRKESRPLPPELIEDDTQEPEAGQQLAISQETTKLRAALAALPEKQRQMIEQAYLGELTHQEINALTGLPLGTIKSRIRLGLDRLRHALTDLRET